MCSDRLGRHIMLYMLVAGICILAMVDTCVFCYPSFSTTLLPDFLICCLSIVALSHIAMVRYAVNNSSVLFLFAWIAFIFIYSQFVPCEYYRLIYIVSTLLFAIDLICLYGNGWLKWLYVENIFLVGAFLQILSILLQVIHCVPSGSEFFSVTGFCDNPSATAIFLVSCLPFVVKRLNITKGNLKILYVVFFLIIFLAILALKCRTAYVGSIIALSVSYYKQIKCQVQKIVVPYRMIVLFLFVVMFLFAGYSLYKMKINSSDGRIFIWKNSVQMVMEKPLGYGYGMFEKEYNLKQSAYFQNEKRDEKEVLLANHVFMPYNDTLEQCVEGGLIGVLFYLMFYAIMICKSYKRKKYDTLAVALCTLGMSMFNFLYTYPIVWLLLMCNYAEISIDEKKIKEEKTWLSRRAACALACLFCILIAVLFRKNLNFIKVQYQLKKANQLLDKNIVVDAGYITSLKNDASTSELYYTSLAKNFLLSGRYNRAVEALLVAKDYTSSPSVYLTLASCYAREGKTVDAIQCVQIAKGIIPHHFFPEIILFRLYVQCEDDKKAMEQAHHILKKPIKVHSEKVNKIRNEVLKYIQAYEK